ncbi:FAD/NAD-P-binding domain-containing protein [Amylocystis lapponica]|nr:FAD/NAD-P-binding domain-containing protein [Amylocystis lapponica]
MQVDAVVFGTGLTESIVAAALAKAGYKVAHADTNPYYGGDDASLTLDELIQWADKHADASDSPSYSYLSAQRARFTSIARSSTSLPQSRQYSLSLSPAIIPSVGPLIDSLVASGVSRYGGFKLLERVAIYDRPGYVKTVPGSKEDVFKSKALSLLEKRRLMRFLLFASGEFEGKKELEGREQTPFFAFLKETFSLDDQSAGAIVYALAFCTSASDPTLRALQRIRRYLRSSGRYGASPFLVGHYGGLGEIAQGFCRTSAVNGATYILGRNVTFRPSAAPSPSDGTSANDAAESNSSAGRHVIELEDLPEQLTCDLVISSPDYISPLTATEVTSSASDAPHSYAVARCVAIIDRPISFTSEEVSEPASQSASEDQQPGDTEDNSTAEPAGTRAVDTALLVFPPSTLPDGSSTVAVNVLVTGEGTVSAPPGKWILHIFMPLLDATSQTAERLLRPYLDAALSLTTGPSSDSAPADPLFTLFYIQHPPTTPPALLSPTSNPATVLVVPPCSPLFPEVADSTATVAEGVFWRAIETLKALGTRPRAQGEDGGDSVEVDVDAFWPPLDAVADDMGDEW